jgi:hypothetical protein
MNMQHQQISQMQEVWNAKVEMMKWMVVQKKGTRFHQR